MTRAAFVLTSEPAEKNCLRCGSTFSRKPGFSHVWWKRAKYCSAACSHAHRIDRYPLADRFESKVLRGPSCWEWQGIKDKNGYGLLPFGGKQLRAHAVSLALDGRPVPRGKYGCHTCDNPGCVRPDHLYVGTPADNMRDARVRGRLRLGEKCRASRLTEASVRAIRSRPGTHEAIAAEFGVARATVSLIIERKTWRHVV